MKLGFGLYRHQLDDAHLAFARQAGATHIVVHLVDYFKQAANNPRANQPIGDRQGWGIAGDPDRLWSVEEMWDIRRKIESHGLIWEAIENFDPAHWHDVLLDGPRKAEQLANLQTMIRRVGEVGVPIIGYNFSLGGVCGRVTGPFARGGAESVGMDGPVNEPIPRGMVWNMVYDAEAFAKNEPLPPITHEELWSRLKVFLDACVPVAAAAGVRLAAHPDDPPMPTVRNQPRLVYQPSMYQRLLDLHPSPASGLEFCLGTLAEMTEGDILETVDHYSRQSSIAYIHFRNITGKVPHYRETFVDEGAINMLKVVRLLRDNKFQGMLIPDHTPLMTCGAPWHAGMAYAMGYMKAALQSVA